MYRAQARIHQALKVGDELRIGVRRIAPPEPDETVALETRVGLQPHVRRHRSVRVVHAATARIELQTMIRTLQVPRVQHLAASQRREPMGADSREGRRRAVGSPKQYQLLPANQALQRL